MSRTTGNLRYRRSPHLVAHWRGPQLVLESYTRGVQLEASPLVLDILDRFPDWERLDTVAHQLPHIPRELLHTLVDALVEHGALETHATASAWDAWSTWSPAASFFHQTTKDVAFTPRNETNRRLKARAQHDPIPPALKPPVPRAKRIALPPPLTRNEPMPPALGAAPEAMRVRTRDASLSAAPPAGQKRPRGAPAPAQTRPLDAPALAQTRPRGEAALAAAGGAAVEPNKKSGALRIVGFPDVLLSRRTWRRFGRRSLGLDELSTLLGLTWGVQGWMGVDGWGKMALKTAPSGGARHSIEAYVLARRVIGLAPGVYHYQPASHQLHQLRALTPQAARAAILSYLPRQTFYGQASAVILMSAVFARVQWRYAFARAYRTILAEAGHHSQTFCLVATWLGLAPFCTMALADSRIERDLEIDGVSESVLYATGVGPRPPGTVWAPWPRAGETPTRTPNILGLGHRTNHKRR